MPECALTTLSLSFTIFLNVVFALACLCLFLHQQIIIGSKSDKLNLECLSYSTLRYLVPPSRVAEALISPLVICYAKNCFLKQACPLTSLVGARKWLQFLGGMFIITTQYVQKFSAHLHRKVKTSHSPFVSFVISLNTSTHARLHIMNRIMAFAQEAQEVYNNEAVFQHHSSHGWPDAFCVTICRRRRIRVHSVDRVSYG